MKKPQVFNSDRVVVFDCDDTLVLWDQDYAYKGPEEGLIAIESPGWAGSGHRDEMGDPIPTYIYLKPNQHAINLLKHHKSTGSHVTVWSAGGWEWAYNVVQALGLSDFVDCIMCKPNWYVDDLHCSEWMGTWRKVHEDGTIKDGSSEVESE